MRLALFCIIILTAALVTSAMVEAQDASRNSTQPATMVDRLEKLRQSLVPQQPPYRTTNGVQRPTYRTTESQQDERQGSPSHGTSGKSSSDAGHASADATSSGASQAKEFKPAHRARPRTNVVVPRTGATAERTTLQDRLARLRQTQSAERGDSQVRQATATQNVPTLARRPASTPAQSPGQSVDTAASPRATAVRSGTTTRMTSQGRTTIGGTVSRPGHSVVMQTSGAANGAEILLTQQAPQLTTSVEGPRKVSVGRPAQFHVSVRNDGQVEARDLIISVNVPPWAEVDNSTPSAGSTQWSDESNEGHVLQWRLQDLRARSAAELAMTVTVHENRPVKLGVNWTHAPATSGAVVEVVQPKLMMVVAGPDEVLFGETQVYQLTVSNPGTGPAENVMIYLMPLQDSGNTEASHKVGTLRPGETKQLEIELTAREAGTLQVCARAEADGGLNSDAQKDVVVLRSELNIELNGPDTQYAGTEAVFSIRVNNPGTAPAQDVDISAALPRGAELVSAGNKAQSDVQHGKVRWRVSSLAPGEERAFEIRCQLSEPGDNRLVVSGTGAGGVSDSTTALTNVIALADLKLEVSDPQGPVAVGEHAVYEVRIRNRGTKAAEGIDVESFFSEGIDPVDAEGAPHRIGNDGQIVFDTIDELRAGGEIVLKIHGLASEPGNHVFRAEVRCRELETKLAAEETTRFYGGQPGSQQRPDSQEPEERVTLEPTTPGTIQR